MRWRSLTLGDKTYKYHVGKNNVVIRFPKGSSIIGKIVVDFAKLTGMSWWDIERDDWKKNFHIKPKMIADFIREVEK